MVGIVSNALIVYFILNTVIDNLLFDEYLRPISVDIALLFDRQFMVVLNILLTTITVLLGIVYHLPFLIMLRKVKEEQFLPAQKVRITPKKLIPPIFLTIGIYSALSLFTVPTYLFFREVGIEFELNTLLFGNEWFAVSNNLVQYIAVSVFVEEFVFRKLILRRLTRFGDNFACIFTSTIYAMCAESVVLIPLNFALSYTLCFLALRYRSLLITIISRLALMFFIVGMPVITSAVLPAISYNVIINIINGFGIMLGIVSACYYFYKKRISLRSYNGSLFFYDRIRISCFEFSFICAVVATTLVFVGDLRFW